jgi:hypothetical protein
MVLRVPDKVIGDTEKWLAATKIALGKNSKTPTLTQVMKLDLGGVNDETIGHHPIKKGTLYSKSLFGTLHQLVVLGVLARTGESGPNGVIRDSEGNNCDKDGHNSPNDVLCGDGLLGLLAGLLSCTLGWNVL